MVGGSDSDSDAARCPSLFHNGRSLAVCAQSACAPKEEANAAGHWTGLPHIQPLSADQDVWPSRTFYDSCHIKSSYRPSHIDISKTQQP